MQTRSTLLLLGLLAFQFNSTLAQSDFKKVMQSIFQKDYPRYQWRNIPVDGYGVATTYGGKKPNSSRLIFLGGTYAFFGLTKPPSTADSILRPNNIIEAPCSPSLNTSIELHKAGIFKVLLPSIATLFGFSATLSDSVDRTATVDTLEICDRRIEEGAAVNYIESMSKDPLQIQKNYRNDELVLVVRDIIIRKMVISITADSKLASSLDLKLLGSLQKVVGDSAELSVQLSRLSKTTYKMTVTTPVVVGFLAVSKGADSRGELINSKDYIATSWSKKWVITEVPVRHDTKAVTQRK